MTSSRRSPAQRQRARCPLRPSRRRSRSSWAKHADLKTPDGHQRVVVMGRLPEREVMTGIGPVAARQPRVRDREAGCPAI